MVYCFIASTVADHLSLHLLIATAAADGFRAPSRSSVLRFPIPTTSPIRQLGHAVHKSLLFAENFPIAGRMYVDPTDLFADPKTYLEVINLFAEVCIHFNATAIAPISSLGYWFSPVATELTRRGRPTPAFAIRKSDKTPEPRILVGYDMNYRNGSHLALAEGQSELLKGHRVLIFDDVFTSGQTAKAAVDIVEAVDAEVVAVAGFVEELHFGARELLSPLPLIPVLRLDRQEVVNWE